MKTKHICPNGCCKKPGSKKLFVTVAHVAQDWLVDSYGNFVRCLDTAETTHEPDDGNIWTCYECGAEATIEEDAI